MEEQQPQQLTNQPVKQKVSTWQTIKIAFGTLLILIIILLIIQNWINIGVNLIFRELTIPLSVIIITCIFTGFIWGTISANIKNRARVKREREQITR